MSTPAQVGKREYRATISNARDATANLRQMMRKVLRASRSAEVKALAGVAALDIGDIDAALNRLDEIGRTLKK